MTSTSKYISYRETGSFSSLVLDYIEKNPMLYSLPLLTPDLSGLKKAMEQREQFATNRTVLVSHLRKQYEGMAVDQRVSENIERLLHSSTFTITTAHQNNLFTGPLYFFYKILHAIRLANYCKEQFPDQDFVPVYYIGSEDADIEELNHIHVGAVTHQWNTSQQGAVGRMKVDQDLLALLQQVEGEWGVLPHGKEWVDLLKESYQENDTMARATFRLVNKLLGRFGIVVLDADATALKELLKPVCSFDLDAGQTEAVLNPAFNQMKEWGYSLQAFVRPVNLFYLKEGLRQRIEKKEDNWHVVGTMEQFNEHQLKQELDQHPDRFSPNVILRGLYQSILLPDIAFIGGGSEVAYWIPLLPLFQKMGIPFPVLVLRNSFLLVSDEQSSKLNKLGLVAEQLFHPLGELVKKFYSHADHQNSSLSDELAWMQDFYGKLSQKAATVDFTLKGHTESLAKKAAHLLVGLEKKMASATKRKYTDAERQIQILKDSLFPTGQLQERYDNMGVYYARYGDQLFDHLIEASHPLEARFTILTVN